VAFCRREDIRIMDDLALLELVTAADNPTSI
jgi:hypothetical protein